MALRLMLDVGNNVWKLLFAKRDGSVLRLPGERLVARR
ncbi:MAG: hypothetical protein QOF01_757, partial [Thermomicrobiales bacterium]|nr:hypothetical protein [Thermomicrobiales bacterium]